LIAGDTTPLQLYEKFQKLLGDNYENLDACLALLNKYFKAIDKGEAFQTTADGKFKLPLELHSGFHWKARGKDKSKNWDLRRDIYAAWVLVRDRCSGQDCALSSFGEKYKATHADWKVLTYEEFKALYKPAATKPRLNLKPATIRGVKVVEFTA
jgi:hypothetical protein